MGLGVVKVVVVVLVGFRDAGGAVWERGKGWRDFSDDGGSGESWEMDSVLGWELLEMFMKVLELWAWKGGRFSLSEDNLGVSLLLRVENGLVEAESELLLLRMSAGVGVTLLLVPFLVRFVERGRLVVILLLVKLRKLEFAARRKVVGKERRKR